MPADDDRDHSAPKVVASYATAGEAEVAQAKLRAFGIEAQLDDQIEGGSIPIEGEPGVLVVVRAVDAADAAEVLRGDPTTPSDG